MKPKGWRNESRRHSLASKGIKTAQKIPTMPRDERFQGYTNMETGMIKVLIDQDRGLVERFDEFIREGKKNKEPLLELRLEDELKEWYDEVIDDFQEDQETQDERYMILEIGKGNRVNWREIAENMIETYPERNTR